MFPSYLLEMGHDISARRGRCTLYHACWAGALGTEIEGLLTPAVGVPRLPCDKAWTLWKQPWIGSPLNAWLLAAGLANPSSAFQRNGLAGSPLLPLSCPLCHTFSPSPVSLQGLFHTRGRAIRCLHPLCPGAGLALLHGALDGCRHARHGNGLTIPLPAHTSVNLEGLCARGVLGPAQQPLGNDESGPQGAAHPAAPLRPPGC